MTCAITIFINLRLRIWSNSYLGDYDDFTPIWFKSIGFSLGLTLLLKILTLPFFGFMKAFYPALKRFCDRGCSFSKKQTKKTTQDDLETLYTDPEFDIDFGYTEIINIIFVAFTISPMLPYAFYIAFIFLILLYWKDKYLCKLHLTFQFLHRANYLRSSTKRCQQTRGISYLMRFLCI